MAAEARAAPRRLQAWHTVREQRERAPAKPAGAPPGDCAYQRGQARAGSMAARPLRRAGRPAPKAHSDPRDGRIATAETSNAVDILLPEPRKEERDGPLPQARGVVP